MGLRSAIPKLDENGASSRDRGMTPHRPRCWGGGEITAPTRRTLSKRSLSWAVPAGPFHGHRWVARVEEIQADGERRGWSKGISVPESLALGWNKPLCCGGGWWEHCSPDRSREKLNSAVQTQSPCISPPCSPGMPACPPSREGKLGQRKPEAAFAFGLAAPQALLCQPIWSTQPKSNLT